MEHRDRNALGFATEAAGTPDAMAIKRFVASRCTCICRRSHPVSFGPVRGLEVAHRKGQGKLSWASRLASRFSKAPTRRPTSLAIASRRSCSCALSIAPGPLPVRVSGFPEPLSPKRFPRDARNEPLWESNTELYRGGASKRV